MTQWGLDALFNPAKRHMDEEKRRLQSTRSEIGDSSGGKRIDLESGKVVIAKAGEDDDVAGADGVTDKTGKPGAQGGKPGAQGGKPDAKHGKPSPAAERAAKRRAARSAP